MEEVKESCSESKTDVPNSSGSKDLSKSLPVEAFNNFLQGKRHMLVQDYTFAVQSLAVACQMYVEHFGELAIECAEVYLLYGKALFRLSQRQSGVLGDALNDGSNEEENSSESEGKENESDKNSDGEEGEENEVEDEADGDVNDQDKEEKEPSESTDSPPAVVDEGSSEAKAEVKSEIKVESNSEIKTEMPESSETADPSHKEESEKGTADDHTTSADNSKMEESMDGNNEAEEEDIELAWNALETAKTIFQRQNTVEAQLKIAEILQLLAEISMESDNNAAAISDLTECLTIQKKHLKPDDRILAETYYQMGLALMLDKIYPEALKNFRTTKEILELRVENLKKKPIDDADGTFASADLEVEISDLKEVLLDIKEKIDDTEELICNKKRELEESSFGEPGSSSAFKENDEQNSPSKPVSNITHLLKRKKPDEGTSEEGAKRIKISGVLNGDSKVTATKSASSEVIKN